MIHVISGISQNFKNMQDKAGGCTLQFAEKNSITEFLQDIFQNFQNTLKKPATPQKHL